MKILLVAGARPNFVKIAPLLKEIRRYPEISRFLVHTGQHYDVSMAESFFHDLDIPLPDVSLGVGSGSHAFQTGEVMKQLEPILKKQRPHVVLVVGDVNSTLAAALTAAKLNIPVAHVEAGLRSFDPTMPEEINRVLTDQISDYLFVSEESGMENLRREGVDERKLFFVGNVMIDSLEQTRHLWGKSDPLPRLGLHTKCYAVLTLHRPSNVDDKDAFTELAKALSEVAAHIPIIFPVHPRAAKRIKDFGLEKYFNLKHCLSSVTDPQRPVVGRRSSAVTHQLRAMPPMAYLDFITLLANARLVLTDSGGIQEESTILSVPCLTLRENTERPVTVTCGTNKVVGSDPSRIKTEALQVLKEPFVLNGRPPLWDGKAAERIIQILRRPSDHRTIRP